MENTVRVMRTRRNCGVVPALPDELVLWEILVRLPAKDLLRCRAACRSWHCITSDAAFLVVHHRHQPSLPLILFQGGHALSARVDAFDLRHSPAMRRPILAFSGNDECHMFTIHASFDSLLLLSFAYDCFYICNPATRQWCALPDLTGGNVAALYPHRPSGEYRVLYRKHPKDSYYVLTVGSSERQRCIGLPVPSPSLKKVTDAWLTSDHSPVLLHDCLHWYPGGSLDTESKVVVFDTVDESFRCMQSPIAGYAANLRQMDGTLCVCHLDPDTMTVQVWALQDYGMEVWSLTKRLQLPLLEMMIYVSERSLFGWEVVSENGDLLVHGSFPWYLFHCDSKGKLVNKFQMAFLRPRPLGLCFKESLVRHAFFQRKDDDCLKLRRFFRWR